MAVVLTGGITVFLIHKYLPDDKLFLTQVFIAGLLARLAIGFVISYYDLHNFFGQDALTYHDLATKMTEVWFGNANTSIFDGSDYFRMNHVGWGMSYIVAGIYSVFGSSLLVAQSIFAVVGAAIAPMIYNCGRTIFNNRRVAKVSALLAALVPSFIIWTGQLLKDGLIVFLLVLAMTMVLRLQKKFDYLSLCLLVISLFGIISLRFYIFYMIAVAVVGIFVVGSSNSPVSVLRRFAILAILGISLTYLGVIRYAGTEFETYGNLERIQQSRKDLANRADSGFGSDFDVSTTEGAIMAIPIGLTYLLLAPFPWQMENLRQLMTLPDMLVWWSSIPFMLFGIFYSFRNQLRRSIGILIFTVLLSLAYSIFQGNIGTAYRQRVQIQVFLFIFVGVGYTLFLERRENSRNVSMEKRKEFNKKLRENAVRQNQENETLEIEESKEDKDSS